MSGQLALRSGDHWGIHKDIQFACIGRLYPLDPFTVVEANEKRDEYTMKSGNIAISQRVFIVTKEVMEKATGGNQY